MNTFFFPLNRLPINDELVWDNGTAYPEPCIDHIADTVGKVTKFYLLLSFHF